MRAIATFWLLTIGLVPLGAVARDVALVVGVAEYDTLPDPGGAVQVAALATRLEAAGFEVIRALDPDAAEAARAARDFAKAAQGADRVLVFLSGLMVATARDQMLLSRDAGEISAFDVGGVGLPLGPVLDLVGDQPGKAVVLLAPSDDAISGAGLSAFEDVAPPQGVMVLHGPLDGVIRVANEALLVPGGRLGALPRGVIAEGFVPPAFGFLPPVTGAAPATPDPEAAFWQVVRDLATAEAYRLYLEAFPEGRFGAEARQGLAALEADVGSQRAAAEAAIGLDAEGRRAVQRNLALLGHDPRGIDGIFGPGTRAAIAAWQRASGREPSGFLDTGQHRALSEAGAARAAVLAAEAEARRAEEEARDRAYWRDTGRGADEAGLRAYLERFPDGLYSEVARARLAEIEAAARAEAAAEERAAWDAARASDTEAAYRTYLDRYPRGAFAEAATARIAELRAAAEEAVDVEAAKAEEAQVAGNRVARLLVETRLAALGFDPGPVDGTFSRESRRALRQFQRARDLPVSGYVTRVTMAHLLAGG